MLASICSSSGQIEVDQEVYEYLLRSGQFQQMRLDVDEVAAPEHTFVLLCTRL